MSQELVQSASIASQFLTQIQLPTFLNCTLTLSILYIFYCVKFPPSSCFIELTCSLHSRQWWHLLTQKSLLVCMLLCISYSISLASFSKLHWMFIVKENRQFIKLQSTISTTPSQITSQFGKSVHEDQGKVTKSKGSYP